MKQLDVLAYLAEKFNQAELTWCLGAGAMLYLRGILDQFGDLDLFVTSEDYEKAHALLLQYTERHVPGAIQISQHFDQFQHQGISVDLISGFTILKDKERYRYRFPQQCEVTLLKGVSIPLAPLEDWMIAYFLLGRESKYQLIRDILKKDVDLSFCFERIT